MTPLDGGGRKKKMSEVSKVKENKEPVTETRSCVECQGDGKWDGVVCEVCKGSGKIFKDGTTVLHNSGTVYKAEGGQLEAIA